MAQSADEAEVADITETPAFQMAIAKATAEIQERILEEVRSIKAGKPAIEDNDDDEIKKLARAIALSNAEIADQGTRRKRVSPAVMEARAQSLKRMHSLLEAAQTLPKREKPLYRVRSKGYFGDRLIEPFQRLPGGRVVPTMVTFMSAPNLALQPANEAAEAIYEAFIGTISGGDQTINGRSVPDPSGSKPFWMTNNGAIISTPTATAREHGMVMEAEPITLDNPLRGSTPDTGEGNNMGGAIEVLGPDDPRATKINVLGTIAPPATRGSIDSRVR